MTHRIRHPAYTLQVFEVLKAADDFMTLPQIDAILCLGTCRVSAALHHLIKHSAVDAVEGIDTLWWFATPDDDTRVRIVNETTEHVKSTRRFTKHPRRKRVEKPKRGMS